MPILASTARSIHFSLLVAALAAPLGCDAENASPEAASSTSDAISAIGKPIFGPTPPIGPVHPIGTPYQPPSIPDGCETPQVITDLGYPSFRVYADVNNDRHEDYCRFVGVAPNEYLSCQLACPSGNYGVPYGFNSVAGIDQGDPSTQIVHDINADGLADFCRTVGNPGSTYVSCDLATYTGFDPNQYTVSLPPNTPMFSVATTQVQPTYPVAGQPFSVTMSFTNNLPYENPGLTFASLTPSAGGTSIYAPTESITLEPNATVKQTVTMTAPATAGVYTLSGAFQQSDGHAAAYDSAQTATQSVQVMPQGIGSACGVRLLVLNEYAVIGNRLRSNWTMQRPTQPAGYGDPLTIGGTSYAQWFDDQGIGNGGYVGPFVTASTATNLTLALGGTCGQTLGTITAGIAEAVAPSVILSASATSIAQGATVALAWYIGQDSPGSECDPFVSSLVATRVSDGATLMTETPDLKAVNVMVTPASSTTYTITSTCVNTPSLSTKRSVTVTVASGTSTSPTSCVPAGGAAGRSLTFVNSSQDDLTIWSNDQTLGTWNEDETISPGEQYTFTPAASQSCHRIMMVALDDTWIQNSNDEFGTDYSADSEATAQTSTFQAGLGFFYVQSTGSALSFDVDVMDE